MNVKTLGLAAVAMGVLAAPAFGHHSHAMFNAEQTIELSGTVNEFQWTNPHSWMQVTIENEQGRAVEWSVEMGSSGGLARSGWRPRTILPGDEIIVTLHPLNDGSPGGQFLRAVLANGEVLGE